MLKGEKAVSAGSFSVPSEKLDCGNKKMNEHMLKALKALKATEHPVITFKLSSYDLAEAATGALKVDEKVQVSFELFLKELDTTVPTISD